ncbi:PREDICTED: ER membrane protein complex subunit 10-like, partial [Rhagoletis zephyria]|uniref:ER membrane protein complex subunit 10-like n=1 Tax=Rhagoletis zephyria TaxID=28612 RepID=UPI0008113F59
MINQESAISGDFYYLKAQAYRTLDMDNEEPYQVSTTFLRSCALLESLLSDQLVINLDVNGKPETKTYLQRIEQERQEKLRGAKQDNRSFLAKYWMYIVPVVIFMVISGMNPEGGASG